MVAKHNQLYTNRRYGLVEYTRVMARLPAFCFGTAPVDVE